jgi:hypothetical protein
MRALMANPGVRGRPIVPLVLSAQEQNRRAGSMPSLINLSSPDWGSTGLLRKQWVFAVDPGLCKLICQSRARS